MTKFVKNVDTPDQLVVFVTVDLLALLEHWTRQWSHVTNIGHNASQRVLIAWSHTQMTYCFELRAEHDLVYLVHPSHDFQCQI